MLRLRCTVNLVKRNDKSYFNTLFCIFFSDINTDYIRDELTKATSETVRLNEVCNPLDIGQMSISEQYEPEITYFKHPPAAQEMLHPLGYAAESVIFKKLWEQQAQSVKNDVSGELTVADVEERIWREVLDQVKSIYDSVSNADIKLADVDSLFSDFKDESQIQQQLGKMSVLFEDKDNDWIGKRTGQIIEYRQVQLFQSDMAIHMLAMQEALELEGDFQALDTLSQMVSKSQNAYLSLVTSTVWLKWFLQHTYFHSKENCIQNQN